MYDYHTVSSVHFSVHLGREQIHDSFFIQELCIFHRRAPSGSLLFDKTPTQTSDLMTTYSYQFNIPQKRLQLGKYSDYLATTPNFFSYVFLTCVDHTDKSKS